MTTKVKWFANTMPNAPIVSNSWGDLTAMLDACLVNGFNLKSVVAISRSGTTATVTLGSGHGFIENQVLLVMGADQAEYNGEHTVTSTTNTTVTFEVSGAPATPATGTITMKVAPLGFEIVYTGTYKRVYRSPNVLSNRPYLRVDDSCPTGYTTTWAKFGRVTLAENMTDLDTFVGARAPYDPLLPTKNETPSGTGTNIYSGWFKWYYAKNSANESNGDGGAYGRSWFIVGDDRGFYLIMAMGWQSSESRRVINGMMEFNSFKSSDKYNSILFASERYRTAGDGTNSYPVDDCSITHTNSSVGRISMRNWTQIGDNSRMALFALNDSPGQGGGGCSNMSGYFPFPNGPDFGLILHPIYLRDTGNSTSNWAYGHLRGILPGALWIHQYQPYAHGSILENVAGYPGRKFMVITSDYNNVYNGAAFAYDITGPWW